MPRSAWSARSARTRSSSRDSPGFATSRLGVALGLEAIRMVEEGVAGPEDIDRAMVLGYRYPVGLAAARRHRRPRRQARHRHQPQRRLRRALRATSRCCRRWSRKGVLGKKSGQGFYTW